MQPTKKKPNKQPVNAFFFYALDFRAKQAKKGIIFDNITQATNAASPSWQKLSPQERVFYEVQSKQNKLNKQSNGSPNVTKYTSQGVSYDEIDRMKLDKENAEKAMRNVIKEILQVAQENGSLDRTTFYFISTVSFCQTLNGEIFPGEIGVAKFSLREGVFDSLHIYVNPGKLPLGFTSGAQELALKTHQLPIPPDAMGLTNYVDILSQLVNFVANADSHDFPIFFTNGKEINDTKRVIDKISQEAGELDLDIKIYPIEELFFPLKQITVKMSNDQNNTTEQPFVNIFLAKDMIDRDTYMYTKNVGCKFHDELDAAEYCALSKAKRWCYRIADFCSKDLRIQYIAGQHVPDECDVSQANPAPIKKYEDVKNRAPSSSRASESGSSYNNNDNASGRFSTSTRYSDKKPSRVFDNRHSSASIRDYHNDYPDLGDSGSQMDRRVALNDNPEEPSSSSFSFANVATGRGIPFSKQSTASSTGRSMGRGYRPE